MQGDLGVTTETYTLRELDELIGASLFLGRVHNCIASLLDTTQFLDDAGLIEMLNHAPVSLVSELLPSTEMLLNEVAIRIVELQRSVSSALDSNAERAAEALLAETENEEFAKIMHVEFSKDRKKNGG